MYRKDFDCKVKFLADVGICKQWNVQVKEFAV